MKKIVEPETKELDHSSQLDPAMRYVMLESPMSSQDDEISLLDLWLVLVKRKKLLLSIVLLVLFLGVVFALMMPRQYNYSTAIEIGAMSYDGSNRPVYIESPSSLLAKINKSYIPLIIQTYIENHPESRAIPQIKAQLEKNSNILFIDLKGEEKFGEAYIELLNTLVVSVQQDHHRISLLKRKDLELSKNKVKNVMFMLKEDEKLLLSQSKRLDKKKLLLEGRINESRDLLRSSAKIKQSAIKEVGTEGQAISLMMVDSEMRKDREVLADLEEELYIELENTREIMMNQLTENRQKQARQNEELEKITMQQDNLLETRAITRPLRSIKPVGTGKTLIVIISLFIGVFLALFIGFFSEFLEKARNHSVSV